MKSFSVLLLKLALISKLADKNKLVDKNKLLHTAQSTKKLVHN